MRLRSPPDGDVLGDRVYPSANDVPSAPRSLPKPGYPKHSGHLSLLHERHDNGLHRWPHPGHSNRALQPAHAHRPRGHAFRRLQPPETTCRTTGRHHLPLHVDLEYSVHCHDGADNLCCAAGA